MTAVEEVDSEILQNLSVLNTWCAPDCDATGCVTHIDDMCSVIRALRTALGIRRQYAATLLKEKSFVSRILQLLRQVSAQFSLAQSLDPDVTTESTANRDAASNQQSVTKLTLLILQTIANYTNCGSDFAEDVWHYLFKEELSDMLVFIVRIHSRKSLGVLVNVVYNSVCHNDQRSISRLEQLLNGNT